MFGGKNKGVWTANMAALGVNVIIAFYRSITRTHQQIDHKLIRLSFQSFVEKHAQIEILQESLLVTHGFYSLITNQN
jgi:hypothetical protein